MTKQQPPQPLITDENGTLRFQGNAIIESLVRTGVIDLNKIDVTLFDKADVSQFWQLLGYGVSAYNGLSFVEHYREEETE